MAQVPPIDDSYIDDIIKSAGPFDPTLTTTQGIKLRELFKQLRDRIEQGSATPPFNPTAGTGVILSGTYPNIQIGVDVGRGPNQIVAKNENADIIVGRVAIIGADGAASDDLSVGATVQISNTSSVLASRGARMQLGDDGDIVFKTFTGPGDGSGSWFNRVRIKNAGGTIEYSENLSGIYSDRSLVDKAYVDSRTGSNLAANSFMQSSERVLKDNIQPYIGNALDKVNALAISSFTYKSDEEKNLKVGFIADDTDSLFSTKDKNVMDIGTTLAISLKAIQELSAEIAQLKEKLNLDN